MIISWMQNKQTKESNRVTEKHPKKDLVLQTPLSQTKRKLPDEVLSLSLLLSPFWTLRLPTFARLLEDMST